MHGEWSHHSLSSRTGQLPLWSPCGQLQICKFLITLHIYFCWALWQRIFFSDHVAFRFPPLLFGHSPELEACCCLLLGQSGAARWPAPAWESLRNPGDLQTNVPKYSVAGVWLQMEEHPRNTLPVKAVLIGKAFTVLDDWFHAGFWKIGGFFYPMVYREGFLRNLGWRLLPWCNRFYTRWRRLTLVLWTLHFTKPLLFCCSDALNTEHLRWHFKHICIYVVALYCRKIGLRF